MKLVRCINPKSKLSIDYINSFGNRTAVIIGDEGLSIDLDENTDLSRKINKYISNGILYIDKTPQPKPKPKAEAVNPFEAAAKATKETKIPVKAEAKAEPKEEKTASDSEVKVDSKLTEKKEESRSRPAAKKK